LDEWFGNVHDEWLCFATVDAGGSFAVTRGSSRSVCRPLTTTGSPLENSDVTIGLLSTGDLMSTVNKTEPGPVGRAGRALRPPRQLPGQSPTQTNEQPEPVLARDAGRRSPCCRSRSRNAQQCVDRDPRWLLGAASACKTTEPVFFSLSN
jgi:hypothetical protein